MPLHSTHSTGSFFLNDREDGEVLVLFLGAGGHGGN